MKITKVFSVLFGLVFVLLLSATVFLAVNMRSAEPMLLTSMESAEIRTEALMTAICEGDLTAAEKLISGKPDLAEGQSLTNPFTQALWEAYGDSLSYRFDGGCYTTNYGVYRDVTVTSLDIPHLMKELQAKAAILLANKAALNPQSAYNDDGSYREEFISETLAQQAKSMINSHDFTTTRSLTLQLKGESGKWMIMGDRALMNLISGGMGGA